MASPIPGYLTAQQTAERLNITTQAVYNLNSQDNDFPTPTYAGRTPLWKAEEIDAWRTKHPARSRP